MTRYKYRFLQVGQASQRRNIYGCGPGVRTSIGTLTSRKARVPTRRRRDPFACSVATVRNRSQPFANVRNRISGAPSFCKRVFSSTTLFSPCHTPALVTSTLSLGSRVAGQFCLCGFSVFLRTVRSTFGSIPNLVSPTITRNLVRPSEYTPENIFPWKMKTFLPA